MDAFPDELPAPFSRPQLLTLKMGQSQGHDLAGPGWTREHDNSASAEGV